MLTYVHSLPEKATRGSIDKVQVSRTIIEDSFIHSYIVYGSTDESGEFTEENLVGTHKLVVSDMASLMQDASQMKQIPETKGDLIQAAAAALCHYADKNDLWATQQ